MKLRKPWMIRLAAACGARLLRIWIGSLRCRVDSLGQQIEPWHKTLRERYIYSLWHENLLGTLALRSAAPITTLVSQSADGELLAQLISHYGSRTVRGSSSHGGLDALEDVLALKGESHLIVAPDGPRGPRRQVKRGLVYLASWTRMPIVPVGIAFRSAWRTKSWDRLALPVPGTLLCIVGGPVIRVPEGASKRTLEEYRLLVERTMGTAMEVADAWAQGRTRHAQWPSSMALAA